MCQYLSGSFITIAYETVVTTRNSKSDTLDNKGNDVVVSYSHFQ